MFNDNAAKQATNNYNLQCAHLTTSATFLVLLNVGISNIYIYRVDSQVQSHSLQHIQQHFNTTIKQALVSNAEELWCSRGPSSESCIVMYILNAYQSATYYLCFFQKPARAYCKRFVAILVEREVVLVQYEEAAIKHTATVFAHHCCMLHMPHRSSHLWSFVWSSWNCTLH
jgi:hypothetical protein